MVLLTRTTRFILNPPGADARAHGGAGGFAGQPAMQGLGRYYELETVCRGEPDPVTGYLVDIKTVDSAVRGVVVPLIERACAERPGADPAFLLQEAMDPLARALPVELARVRWRLTPYHCVEMSADAPTIALIRQRFEFSASHRLHAPELSDEENRRIFGKCNNPSGHGHNYQLEPCVAVNLGADGPPFGAAQLEQIVDEVILRRFDHKHLNLDTEEFGPGGVTPSVERIAQVCFDLLAGGLRAQYPQVELRCVTVWETDRTSCTYPG
ncbi:MAG: 6-carboxytetrahydropterin synthase [Phycisphaerales bacterium JB039]